MENIKHLVSFPKKMYFWVKIYKDLTNSSDRFFSDLFKTDPELEKSFPGVLISANSDAFDMLNRLEDFDEPRIRTRIRNIIKLVPTNPRLLDSFDTIIGKMVTSSSATLTSSTASVAAATASTSTKSSSFTKSPSSSSISNQVSQSYNASSTVIGPSATQQLTSLSQPSTPTLNSHFLTGQFEAAHSFGKRCIY